jgi:hypothetical protein
MKRSLVVMALVGLFGAVSTADAAPWVVRYNFGNPTNGGPTNNTWIGTPLNETGGVTGSLISLNTGTAVNVATPPPTGADTSTSNYTTVSGSGSIEYSLTLNFDPMLVASFNITGIGLNYNTTNYDIDDTALLYAEANGSQVSVPNDSLGQFEGSSWQSIGFAAFVSPTFVTSGIPMIIRITNNGDPDDVFRLRDITISGNFTPIPEPATLVLLGLGVVGAGLMLRRRSAVVA